MSVILSFIFGSAFGSFLNVLIDRLPVGESVVRGRSHCDHCRRTLTWYELIPLLSYIIQGGKSRCCGKKLSLQYPLVELTTGIGFGLIYLNNPSLGLPGLSLSKDSFIGLLVYWVIYSCLLVIFIADLKTQIIPDSMLVVSGIAVIIMQFIARFTLYDISNTVLSAFGAMLFFLALYLITRGRGMGFGDVKLAFILGLLTGYPGIVIALYIAFLTGAFLGVILVIGKQKSLKSKVPFGPFLIAGTLIAMVWQVQILEWWKGVI